MSVAYAYQTNRPAGRYGVAAQAAACPEHQPQATEGGCEPIGKAAVAANAATWGDVIERVAVEIENPGSRAPGFLLDAPWT